MFYDLIVMSLVFITIGEDDEKMFTDLAPLMKYTITNHENTEVKAAVSPLDMNKWREGNKIAADLNFFAFPFC